jgi:hypothetical protein
MTHRLDQKDWLLSQLNICSVRELARRCGVAPPTVRYWMKKHNIPTQSISDGMIKQHDHISNYSKAYWSEPEHKKEQSDRMIKIQAKRKQELSASAKKNWVKNRDKIISGIKKGTTTEKRIKIANSVKKSWTAQRRLQQSQITKLLWADPAYQIKRATALHQVTDTEQFRKLVSHNSKKLWEARSYRTKQAIANAQNSSSVLEQLVFRLLADRKISAKPCALGPWSFDIAFTYGGRKILIECQGDYWHRKPETILRDKQKSTYYKRYLSDEYELYYIYEYEFYGLNRINSIIDAITNTLQTKEFKLRDVEIRFTPTNVANQFFWAYHYLGKPRAGLFCGAFLKDELIGCCAFSSVTRQTTLSNLSWKSANSLELTRFCIKPTFNKKNFASYFLAHSRKLLPNHITNLVTFADTGLDHNGTIYKADNWTNDKTSNNSYWYIDSCGGRYHKKSVWDQSKRLGLSESQYAELFGLIRITGKPLLRFIRHHGK